MQKSIIGGVLGCILATSAYADIIKAPVVNKTPIYGSERVYVGTVTECRDIYIENKKNSGGVFDGPSNALKGDGAALFGTILGGVIGNQFGGGSGKTAATVAGAIIGGNMANKTYESGNQITKRTICDEVAQYEEKKRVVAWDVKYEFEGRHFTTRLAQDPGSHIMLETHTSHTVRN